MIYGFPVWINWTLSLLNTSSSTIAFNIKKLYSILLMEKKLKHLYTVIKTSIRKEVYMTYLHFKYFLEYMQIKIAE